MRWMSVSRENVGFEKQQEAYWNLDSICHSAHVCLPNKSPSVDGVSGRLASRWLPSPGPGGAFLPQGLGGQGPLGGAWPGELSLLFPSLSGASRPLLTLQPAVQLWCLSLHTSVPPGNAAASA